MSRTIRIAVVLPAPLAPSSPKIRPGSTVNDALSRATISPKRLVTESRTRDMRRPATRNGGQRTGSRAPARGAGTAARHRWRTRRPASRAAGRSLPIWRTLGGREGKHGAAQQGDVDDATFEDLDAALEDLDII